MKKWIFFAILSMPLTAGAEYIRFDYDGVCTIDCGNLGLSAGDAVSGFLETLTGLDDDNVLFGSELSDWGFTFGSILVSPLTHIASGFLVLNDFGTGFTGGDDAEGMVFWQLSNPGTVAATGSIELSGTQEGWVASSYSCFLIWCEGAGGAGPGSYSRPAYLAITEPGSLSLIGIGLIVLGVTRSGRRTKKFA